MNLVEKCVFMIVLLVICTACNDKLRIESAVQTSDLTTPSASTLVFHDSTRVVTNVKSLTDPANPYKNSYKDWDRWLYAHRLQEKPKGKSNDPDWVILFGATDAQRYLIPILEFERMVEQAAKEGRSHKFMVEWDACVYAEGHMAPELRQAKSNAVWQLKASFYPQIPAWLVSDPPKRTMLLSDGRVLCVGTPGSGMTPKSVMHTDGTEHSEKHPLFLYTNGGEMISSHEGGEGYMYDLLNPAFADTCRKARKQGWDGNIDRFDLSRQGYLAFENEAGEVLFIIDFLGAPVTVPVPRDEHYYNYLTAKQLLEIASWQTVR